VKQSAYDYWLTVDPRSKHLFPLIDKIMEKQYYPDIAMCSCDEQLDEGCEIHGGETK
jgi:hypothetical protein